MAYINSFGQESFADDINAVGYETDKFILDLRNTLTNPFRKDAYPCYKYPPREWNGTGNEICANRKIITVDSTPHRITTGLMDEPYIHQTVFCADVTSRNGVILMNRHTLGAASALAYLLFERQNLNTLVLVGDTTGGGNFDVCMVRV